jgi:hypothetical protein
MEKDEPNVAGLGCCGISWATVAIAKTALEFEFTAETVDDFSGPVDGSDAFIGQDNPCRGCGKNRPQSAT